MIFSIVPEGSSEILKKIFSRIKSENRLPSRDGLPVLHLSIGYCSSDEVSDKEEVFKIADRRMYEDKKIFYENEGKIFKIR